MTRRARWCRRLTWLLVGLVAVLAFARSFEAIADYARQHGWGDVMCYVAPLLVDTFTVAAMLVILVRAWEHVRAVYAWVLLVAASVVSVALNVAHAEPDTAAQILAALPPVALLAAVELAMSEARRDRGPAREDVAPIVPGSRSRSRQQATTPAPHQARGDLTPGQRARVEAMFAKGQRSTRAMAREIGRDTGAGRQRVARLVADLQAAPVGRPGQNGDGP